MNSNTDNNIFKIIGKDYYDEIFFVATPETIFFEIKRHY